MAVLCAYINAVDFFKLHATTKYDNTFIHSLQQMYAQTYDQMYTCMQCYQVNTLLNRL